MARRRIAALIREAGKPDMDGLRALDADELVDYVLGTRREWWRRRPCIEALRGRVPEDRVPALINLIKRQRETPEIRIALLEVLHDRAELLPWLRAQQPPDGVWEYGMHDAIVKARARLGDLTAARDAATLANSPWRNAREAGTVALDALVAKHGRAVVEAAVGNTRPEDRAFRLRMTAKSGGDVLQAFADADVGVARTACELVIENGVPDDEMLLDYVVTGPTMNARLFAAYALHRRGRDIRDLWQALDCPRVEIPELDEPMRLAILREYDGAAEHRTDPRWLVERACVDTPPPPDEPLQLARIARALEDANLGPGEPQPIGLVNHQGGGTYHVIKLRDDSTVEASGLGPYVASYDAPPAARDAVERAGFRWIDEALGNVVVDGLCVYYFGHRDPLPLRTLLFYWQD